MSPAAIAASRRNLIKARAARSRRAAPKAVASSHHSMKKKVTGTKPLYQAKARPTGKKRVSKAQRAASLKQMIQKEIAANRAKLAKEQARFPKGKMSKPQGKTLLVYHYTNAAAARSIAKGNWKPTTKDAVSKRMYVSTQGKSRTTGDYGKSVVAIKVSRKKYSFRNVADTRRRVREDWGSINPSDIKSAKVLQGTRVRKTAIRRRRRK